ncbi:MAG: hypothetical protein K2N05_01485 [Muribaculaceae bacterium]|nr:hypothetical protein [Muribaculaceae bacterium]
MKRIHSMFAMLFVALLVMTVSSCKDDKDEPSGSDLQSKLQGSWTIKEMKVSTMGQTITMSPSDLDSAAGQMGLSGYYDKNLDFYGSKVNGTNYTINGNKINIPAWYNDMWGTVTFSGSDMHIIYDVTESGVSMKIDLCYTRTRGMASEEEGENRGFLFDVMPNVLN